MAIALLAMDHSLNKLNRIADVCLFNYLVCLQKNVKSDYKGFD
jgi:hypothetical protein